MDGCDGAADSTCHGKKAGEYVLPNSLGEPLAGRKLPGYVAGVEMQILEDDPDCAAPVCPNLEKDLDASSGMQQLAHDLLPLLLAEKADVLF